MVVYVLYSICIIFNIYTSRTYVVVPRGGGERSCVSNQQPASYCLLPVSSLIERTYVLVEATPSHHSLTQEEAHRSQPATLL